MPAAGLCSVTYIVFNMISVIIFSQRCVQMKDVVKATLLITQTGTFVAQHHRSGYAYSHTFCMCEAMLRWSLWTGYLGRVAVTSVALLHRVLLHVTRCIRWF